MKKNFKSKNNYEWMLFFIIVGLIYLNNSPGLEEKIKHSIFILGVGIILLLIIIFFSKILEKRKKKKRHLTSRIYEIDRMDGKEFELFLKAHFEHKGYKVQLTPTTNDYGADLVVTKNGKKVVIQAKRYNAKVGNKAVQEISGAIGFYRADKGIVVTNSYFTKNAIRLAKSNAIDLWDRDVIIQIFSIK